MEPERQLVEVKDLNIRFSTENGVKTVCDNISFSLEKGEILGLVGESGSGKTMTGLALCGLLPKTALIECVAFNFDAKELINSGLENYNSLISDLRGSEIAIIFQEPMASLNPLITCGNQLIEAVSFSKNENIIEKAKSLFEKVQLPSETFDKYPHQLSGGQLQRVMIAIAISQNPKLLIADEPTTSLDATIRKGILNLLLELKKEIGFSILFISHDLGAVSYVSDRVLVMNQGEIVERGSTKQILTNPKEEYTKMLLANYPTLSKSKNQKSVESEIILSIENLNISYQNQQWLSIQKSTETRAVKNLDLNVFKGEILGIVGESGSGKSSLGKSIIRLVEAQNGTVTFKNNKISELSDNQFFEYRKEIQIIFQNPLDSLNPRQPIGRGIEEVFENFKNQNSQEKAIELLQKVGLSEDDYFKYPHEFSGGQRQRICIARALAVNPSILICDECVSALDVSIQQQILDLLKSLQKEFQLTILFISHDLAVVKMISDRIMVMKDGEIVQIGTANEIFEKPKTDYVRELIEAVPEIALYPPEGGTEQFVD